MKKLAIILVALVSLSFTSCKDKGETFDPELSVSIHGKIYKFISIVPSKNAHPIWIMYPVDSTGDVPICVNYNEKQGKSTVNAAVIIVK